MDIFFMDIKLFSGTDEECAAWAARGEQKCIIAREKIAKQLAKLRRAREAVGVLEQPKNYT